MITENILYTSGTGGEKVEAERTIIDAPKEFEVLTLDIPPQTYEYEFILDEPPLTNES